MCLNAVIAYTQNLGVKAFELIDVFLEGQQFAFSDRSEICEIKGKHHIFLAAVIKQVDWSFVRDGLKKGRFITNLKRSGQNR